MITIFIYNCGTFKQAQLTDYCDPPLHESLAINRYKRVKIYHTIWVHFRAKKRSKQFWKPLIRHTINKNLTTFGVSIVLSKEKRQTSSDRSRLVIGTHQLSLISIEKSEETLDLEPEFPGPYLNTYPFLHIDRFRSVNNVIQTDFCHNSKLSEEWKYYQELEAFHGLFQHMVILNSFEYWDGVERDLRTQDYHPKGFTIQEFIKWEFLRHSMGIASYSDAQRIFQAFDQERLKPIFKHPDRVPAPYHASYYYKWLTPTHFQGFLQLLVKECIDYKIIVPKIVIGDGLIFRTWAGNFSLDRWLKPTDPQATLTVHHKKMLEKCYNGIVFYA